ncbi:MAG: carboxypeptidase regulatory-like domain-containing protein [Clostridia bacterium]|nr:carboxypeptidase regulatory-like domain-containing protein [Clostridia bacterium]
MAKKLKKILVLAVVFTMTFVNYGLPLQAIASEGESFFSFAFFRKNEIAFDAYFDNNPNEVEKILDVNDTAKITLEVSPLIEGYLKSGSLKFNLKNGNENNFKIQSLSIEEKAELELDKVDTIMLEESKINENIVKNESVINNSNEIKNEVVENKVENDDKVDNKKSEDKSNDIETEENPFSNLFKNTVVEDLTKDVSNALSKSSNAKEALSDVLNENTEDAKLDESISNDKIEESESIVQNEAVSKNNEENLLEKARGSYEVSLTSDNEISLKNIIDSTKIFVEIAYKSSEIIKPEDLYGELEITLQGNYINKKLETIEISRKQELTLGWEYSKEIIVNSDFAKVSPFTVGKNTGTILENIVTVKRNIENQNSLPIKQTNIKIEIPKINDKLPIAVNVSANKLMATLGKELTGKEFTKDNWTYDKENGIIEINIINHDRIVGKDEDKFDVICRYEDYLEDEKISLNKKVAVKVEEYSSKENKVQEREIDELQEKNVVAGELMSYSVIENEETIGKGKINANYHIEVGETRFSSKINVAVLTSDILEEIVIEPIKEYYKNKDNVEFSAMSDIMYAGVRFNAAEIKDMLEQGSTIDILDGDGNVFHTISREVNASKIEFASKIDKVKIRINDVKVNGNLSIEFIKSIERSEYSLTEFCGFEKIENVYKGEVKYVGFEETFQLPEIKDEIRLTNTITQANLLMSRTHLSTIHENENVEFKIDLLNNLETSDLYKNPSFELVFPVFVKEVKLNNIYMLYQNGLSIRDYQVINENGINKLIVNLEGIQNGFNFSDITNGTAIIINTNLVVDEITPQKQDEIKLYYCNEAVTNYQTQSYWSISKQIPEGIIKDTNGYDSSTFEYQAPSGLIAVNAITNYDGTGETVKSINQGEIIKTIPIKGESHIATMELTVVNNTNTEYTDMVLLGRIPFKGNTDVVTGEDLGTNVDTVMKSLIIPNAVNTNSAKIYYSANPNADRDLNKDGNGWEIEYSGSAPIKSFMIIVDEKVAPSNILKYKYDFEIPANLGYEVGLSGSFGAFYSINENEVSVTRTKIADKVGVITEPGVKLNATMSVDIGDGTEIGEARFLKYTIKVENTGSVDLKNVVIENIKPNFTWLCDVTTDMDGGNDGYDKVGYNKATFNIDEIKRGESVERIVVAKVGQIPTTMDEYYASTDNLEFDSETNQYYVINSNNERQYVTEIPSELFIENYATIYVDDTLKGFETNKVKNKIIPSNFDIETTLLEFVNKLEPEAEFQYIIDVQNISGETIEDIIIEDILPSEVAFKGLDERFDTCEYEFDEETNKLTLNVGTLNDLENFRAYISCSIDNFKNIAKKIVGNRFIVKSGDIEEYSSLIEREFVGAELIVAQETNLVANEVLEYEKFEVVVNVKNRGLADSKEIKFELDVPEDFEIITLTSESKYPIPTNIDGSKVTGRISMLEPNDEISFILILRCKPLGEGESNRVFNINSQVTESYIGELSMNLLEITVLDNPNRDLTEEEKKQEEEKDIIVDPSAGDKYKEDVEEEKDKIKNETTETVPEEQPEKEPEKEPENEEIQEVVEKEESLLTPMQTYRVTGKVWKDENKNNAKDSNEEGINKVQVTLYEGDAKIKTTITDSLGKYRFSEVPPGNYTIAFSYNGTQYIAAKYKLSNVMEGENSDAIESEEGLAVTEVINIINSNIEINLGLQDRDNFDFEVNKYITKAIVNTKGKEKIENYNNEQLAKLEIRSKELKNTTIKLEYKIVVTNNGNVDGVVGTIKDYLPEALTFDEKENSGWKLGSDGVLYNETLNSTVIKAGESKELKLLLNKKMTEDNVGTISNKVEITNLSTNNTLNEDVENNISTQEMIITVSTGRIISRISIISTLIIITAFIYGIKTGKIKRKYK